ncbi:Purine catabolism regulatory protein [compost metagenome]
MRVGSNTKRVAEELFVHRNSVLYRLERINEILHIDLNDAEIRLRLNLALRFWKMKSVINSDLL